MDNSWQAHVRTGAQKTSKSPNQYEQTPEGMRNWLSDFEGAGASQTPVQSYQPEPLVDQISRMPNSDKLSPVEKWIYQRLPGFSESSVGKALINFGNTPAGKALAKLDVLAEGLERTLGLIAQYRDRDPNETFRLKDAWAAGSIFYDVARLPRVQYDKDGRAIGIQIDTDMPGAYAVTEARKLIEQGKSINDVKDILYQNMGALALRSQLNDSLGHIALDPLNWVLGAIKPVEKLHAIRNLALTGKMDVSAVKAMEQAARASGDLESAAKFAEAIVKAEQQGKALTRLDRFAIALTGGVPYLQKTEKGFELRDVATLTSKQKFWAKMNPFALTPQARASELLDVVAANVGEKLVAPNWHKDPTEFINAVAGASRGAIGPEWGHLASTVQGRTVQSILAQADGVTRSLGLEWTSYTAERVLLEKISGVIPNTDPRALWRTAKNNPELLMRKILTAAGQPGGEIIAAEMQAGRLTPDIIANIGKIDNSIPLLKEEFYTKALVSIQDVAMRQAILQFGITEKGVLQKWSDALKAWETLPFIKINPANAIRNVVNNDITLIGRGLFGTMTPKALDKFWEGKWIPPQFLRGFGFSGQEELVGVASKDLFDPGNAIRQMVDVLEGNGGLATKVKNVAGNIDLKAFDFSKFSARMEQQSSKRAATMGWIQFHQQYWNPRTGYTSVSKALDSSSLDEMERIMPGISDTLDDIAQASKGDAQKFAELMQTEIEHNIPAVFRSVTDRIGYKVEDVLGTEVLHAIEEGLPEAMSKGKVQEFVEGVRLQMEQHVDDMFNRHVENLPGIISAQVQAGGPLQFHRVFGKASDELWGGQIEHAHRMSTINELLDYARQSGDYRKVGSIWNKIQQDSESHFGRIWKKFEAYQKGLAEGAQQAGIKYPEEVSTAFKGIESGWKEFFNFRNKAYREFFDTIEQGGVPKNRFEDLIAEVDKRSRAMIQEEDKLYQQIDDLMTKQLPDKVQQTMYRNWRDQAARLRMEDKEKTAAFFAQVRQAPKEEVPAMWQKYWQERMTRLDQMRALDAKGSAAIQGDTASTAGFFGDTSNATAEPQNIYELASRYNIPSATKTGKRNERRILTTVNKYAKETSATDVQIVDNALLPDEVKLAFKQWDDAKSAVKEAQKTQIEDVVAKQEAVKIAKKAEKEARQAYNDALEQFKIDGKSIDKLLKERTFMNAETIPMNIAKEAFEAQAKGKGAQAVRAAKEHGFVPDAEKVFPDPMPLETAISELNYGRSYAAMDAIVEEAMATASTKSRKIADLPEHLQAKVKQWMNQVNDESSSFRAAGVQYSAFRRDSALLNYNRRTNFDSWVGLGAPFAFWTTHSMANWAIHSLDRPAMLTTYFRARQLFETAGLPDQNVPSRLKGQIRVDLPFAPDWLGTQFVNPLRTLLPFDGFMMPWEQAEQGKLTKSYKTEQTLNQMLEQGMITEDQYQEAMQEKAGDAWDMAAMQVEQGGDNYDAMDFVQMTMTPHAPLMWAYNAMRGTPNEIGPFTPMSRTAKNVATMMGVEDWSNSPYNVEGRIRKSLGLPAYDKWDDYRVARSISNMAADGNWSLEEMKKAMEVAALVESGKMSQDDAKLESKMYKEAITRTNVEMGGWWGGVAANVLGIPLKAYPTGEETQRNLAEEFSRAYDTYDRGDVDALTRFFDEHPEYESRLSLFKSPEERLKSFMVDNIWTRWNSLPKIQQDEIKEQLGSNFETYFMDKNTRSYDALSPEQLNIYLKLMGGKTVGKLSTTEEALAEFNQLKLTDPETAWRVQTFYDTRKTEYADWYDLQNEYYSLSTNQAKSNFRRNNPALVDYWDFRRQWMERNPDLVRFLTDDEKQLKKYERMQRNPEIAVPTADEIRSNFSPETVELMQQYAQGQSLPYSVQSRVDQLAAQYNLTPQQLIGILGVQ